MYGAYLLLAHCQTLHIAIIVVVEALGLFKCFVTYELNNKRVLALKNTCWLACCQMLLIALVINDNTLDMEENLVVLYD